MSSKIVESKSFYIYSSSQQQNYRHIIFHRYKSPWLITNDVGLEIALALDKKESIGNIAQSISQKYEVDFTIAKNDVLKIKYDLDKQGFLKGISDYPKIKISLRTLYIQITNRCNLACSHCYVSSSPIMNTLIPTKDVIRLIDEACELGCKELLLSGGEPLTHKGIKDILFHAKGKLDISIATNGTLIDRKIAQVLAKIGVSVQISLDGTKNEHEKIRGKGTFYPLVRAIRLLQKEGLGKKIRLATTLLIDNYQKIYDIIRLTERLGIPYIKISPVHNIGRASDLEKGNYKDIYRKIYRYLCEYKKNNKDGVRIDYGALNSFFITLPEVIVEENVTCPIGKKFQIDSKGDAFSCIWVQDERYKLGNIYENSIKELLFSKKMEDACDTVVERRFKIDKCSKCRWRNLCQGGCMANPYNQKGTVWQHDDFCEHRRELYKEVFEKLLMKENNV